MKVRLSPVHWFDVNAGISPLGKYQLRELYTGQEIPVFTLLHGSMGDITQDNDRVILNPERLYWYGDMGTGLRINEAFGIMLRIGTHYGSDHKFNGFVALDIGAFGVR